MTIEQLRQMCPKEDGCCATCGQCMDHHGDEHEVDCSWLAGANLDGLGDGEVVHPTFIMVEYGTCDCGGEPEFKAGEVYADNWPTRPTAGEIPDYRLIGATEIPTPYDQWLANNEGNPFHPEVTRLQRGWRLGYREGHRQGQRQVKV